ncbi:MAG: SMP-30/gluconolactonase/LRE family protein [Alphaproteobacteria bacterium]
MSSFDFQPVNDVRCTLGEGPVYDAGRDVLWYCDIIARKIHMQPMDGSKPRFWTFDSEVGSLGLCESGRLIVALRDTIVIFDPANDGFSEIATVERDIAGTRLNDGKVGPDGAFWVGTMDDRDLAQREPIGALYRIDAAGNVEKKVDGLKVSNGLAFSPDGRRMFHADTGGPWIDLWDIDAGTGELANRRRFAEPGDDVGRPDGAATDADGNYWSAGITASSLNKFSPDGELLERHPLPVGAPTMPCFAGPELRRIFVTSLRHGRPQALFERFPLTGITIASDSPVAGAPVARFRDIA